MKSRKKIEKISENLCYYYYYIILANCVFLRIYEMINIKKQKYKFFLNKHLKINTEPGILYYVISQTCNNTFTTWHLYTGGGLPYPLSFLWGDKD